MPELIPRDVSGHTDLTDPVQLAEFQGFGSDVPTDAGMIDAVNVPPPVPTANSVRAARLLRDGYLLGASALATPDPTPANVTFARKGMRKMAVNVPGYATPVEVWSFEDGDGVSDWPAPPIRVREGQVVHNVMGSRTDAHTIHHHGIEPTAMNDGVGHLTFEVDDEYTYQWQAGEAGTYFYHCHRNTTLHFEMGMYGLLIIDPNVLGAPFAFGGPGQCHFGNALRRYHAEAIWVVDDFDLRWHGIDRDGNGTEVDNHNAGIQENTVDPVTGLPTFVGINDTDNPHLHDFRPDVFLVTGRPAQYGVDNAVVATAPGSLVTPRVARGQRLLVRTLNASYCTTRWTFPETLPGLVIAADGRSLGREPFGRYSRPFTLASIGYRFMHTTARRWDILFNIPADAAVGDHEVSVSFHHWITDERLRTIRLRINVTA